MKTQIVFVVYSTLHSVIILKELEKKKQFERIIIMTEKNT